ncbi:MAG: alpha/beta hydrolase [Granulosicoccus sp.]
MSTKLLDSIEINTADQCEYSVIWLHGLGASGHDFEPVVPELNLLDRPGVRFVFPHAPVRPITVNGGAAMRGWYDITSMDFGNRQQDTAGVRDSADHINALIEAEIERGVSAGNILLAGFSQGGAIALFTALTSSHKLGGVMALSTYLPIQEAVLAELTEHGKQLPVFMAHGQFDDVIQIQHAEQSHTVLSEHGIEVEWHSYAMAHSVSTEEVADISAWLKRQFGM